MCLAVPMMLTQITTPCSGIADCEGVERAVDISLLESPTAGDYIIVHAGFAIALLDQAEAEARLQLFAEILQRHHAPPTTRGRPCAT
jgi:hydrogenase expression/formation protein HypC